MQSAATLSILHVNDGYLFHFECPTESSMLPGETIHAPFGVLASTTITSQLRLRLKEDIEVAAEMLRHLYASTGHLARPSSVSANSSLQNLGHLLFDLVLPPDIQQGLVDLPEQMPLILKTDDLSLPWELLHDGQQWLALKRPVGRSLLSPNSPRLLAQRGERGLPVHGSRQLLVISNPTGDLPEADKEAAWLFDNAELGLMSPRLLCRQHASKHTILKELASGQYAIIHYSGHAKAGSLILADGELTAQEIQKALRGRPFIFLNACSSGRGEVLTSSTNLLPVAGSTVQSLATAFILGGASAFIGTLWPIFDVSSREFAEWFYTLVLMNGVSVGEALRQARQRMYHVRSSDPLWASFMLYGDPMLNIASTPPEMRHVTVLVARIEGLFSLFERLELEEASEIREQAIGQLRLIAERYGGQFHAPLSDLLNVHFGVPIAHGGDAEHAIYAALDMIRTLHTFNEQWGRYLSVPLSLRIGISTGKVLAANKRRRNGLPNRWSSGRLGGSACHPRGQG